MWLTNEPNNPANAPHPISVAETLSHSARQRELSTTRDTSSVRPITMPPDMDATVPSVDIPPLVPGGTGWNVVTKRGLDLESIPSSEANVSPRQHAK